MSKDAFPSLIIIIGEAATQVMERQGAGWFTEGMSGQGPRVTG